MPIILLLLLLFTACSGSIRQDVEVNPPMVSINIIDRNGLSETISNPERLEQYTTVDFLQPQPYQKVLRIYMRDTQGNIPACMTSYHPNGCTKQCLDVVNSRACGSYREWHANGQLKLEATVLAGDGDLVVGAEKTWIFDGCCRVWNELGALEASIPYVKGNLEGVSVYYHPNGTIWKSISFHNGIPDGIMEVYCIDGTLLQRINYCRGLKEGEACRYWDGEMISAKEIYSEGLISSASYYDKTRTCIASIVDGNGTRAVFGKDLICEMQQYRFGQLEGEIKVFDRFGRANLIYHVKNGCKHGEELSFYDAVKLQPTLTPKLSINWSEGKIQGIVKTWYQNGVQESQKEMSHNKKNGHHTAWYRDGSLMLIEEYSQDKLMRGEYYVRGEKLPTSMVLDGKGLVTLYDADGNFRQKIEYLHGIPQAEIH